MPIHEGSSTLSVSLCNFSGLRTSLSLGSSCSLGLSLSSCIPRLSLGDSNSLRVRLSTSGEVTPHAGRKHSGGANPTAPHLPRRKLNRHASVATVPH